jgi:carbon storage regulator
MLVLSRKRGERVIIDGGIVVTVFEIRGDKVRLGFESPDSVRVMREEVAQDIEENGAHRRRFDARDND